MNLTVSIIYYLNILVLYQKKCEVCNYSISFIFVFVPCIVDNVNSMGLTEACSNQY